MSLGSVTHQCTRCRQKCHHSHGEEVRTHQANGSISAIPRSMGGHCSVAGRYFLRGVGLFGQPPRIRGRCRYRFARAGGGHADVVPRGSYRSVLLAWQRRRFLAEDRFSGGLARHHAGRDQWIGLVEIGVVGPAIRRPYGCGRGHGCRRRTTAPRSLGTSIGHSRVSFLARRSCFLWRADADASTPRRVRGLVLPELRGMGMGPFS
jgi:hypothetical protein